MADWVKFLQVFAGGGPSNFLSDATMKELLRPDTHDYAGEGIVVERTWAGGHALTHSGSNTMNSATVWIAPEKGMGIVMATNGAKPNTGVVLDRLAGWIVVRYVGTE